MPKKKLLTVTEAAAAMGITNSRVRTLIRAGRLPATKYGERIWLVDEADLAAFERKPPHRPPKSRVLEKLAEYVITEDDAGRTRDLQEYAKERGIDLPKKEEEK